MPTLLVGLPHCGCHLERSEAESKDLLCDITPTTHYPLSASRRFLDTLGMTTLHNTHNSQSNLHCGYTKVYKSKQQWLPNLSSVAITIYSIQRLCQDLICQALQRWHVGWLQGRHDGHHGLCHGHILKRVDYLTHRTTRCGCP